MRWQEQRALALAFLELAEEFDGEETMHVELRAFMDDFTHRVQEMAGRYRSLGYDLELKVPSPEQEQFALEVIIPRKSPGMPFP